MKRSSFNLNDDLRKPMLRDLELRLQCLDILCEAAPLNKYLDWTQETLKTAKGVEGQAKIGFYDGPSEASIADFKQMLKELNQCIRDYNAIGKRSPVPEHSISNTEGDEIIAHNES